MNAETFCDPATDRGFVLATMVEMDLIALAHAVDRFWQTIPDEPEERVSQVLACLHEVYCAIGSLIVREDRGTEQKAIVSFLDKEPGKITMYVEFRPAVDNGPVRSPAVQAAMEVMEIFTERHRTKIIESEVPA